MSEYKGLVTQAQSSEPNQRNDAFDQLMNLFGGMAFRHAYSTLGDSQMAEDVTQDAFLTAYQRIEQLREPEAFPTWLRRIISTQCDRIFRRNRPAVESLDTHQDLPSTATLPEEQFASEERRRAVQEAIATLPEKQQSVTRLYYLNGASQKEIAEELDLPLTTVKKRLQYARQQLKMSLGEWNIAFVMILTSLFPQQTVYQPALIPVESDQYVQQEYAQVSHSLDWHLPS